jgi:hypothetical protein
MTCPSFSGCHLPVRSGFERGVISRGLLDLVGDSVSGEEVVAGVPDCGVVDPLLAGGSAALGSLSHETRARARVVRKRRCFIVGRSGVEGLRSGEGATTPLLDFDDGFDRSEIRIGKFIELGGDFFDGEAVGDPDLGVDVAGFNDFNDFAKVGGKGVAGGEEGLLTAMEDGGVGKGEVFGGDADVDDTGGEAPVFEAGGHGFDRAGGIDDDVGKVAVGQFLELGEVGSVHLEWDAIFDAELVSTEGEAGLHHVHDDDFDIGHELEEFEAGEADGSGPDDEDGFARLGVAALDGVVADGEGFNEGEFIVGKGVSGVEFVSWDNPGGCPKTAGLVHPDNFNAGAAVALSFFGGPRFGVVDVGLKRTFVACFDVGDAFADLEDFESEFVAGGAGIVEEGELAEVAGKVGAADAHAVGEDEGLAGAGGGFGREIDGVDFPGVCEFDCEHLSCEF